MLDRTGAIPRSTLYLAGILVLAAAVLWFVRGGDDAPTYALGGPVFHTPPAEVKSILVTTGGLQHRLERSAAGVWTLTGAYEDHLNQEAMANLLTDLSAATGGRLLPGTDPEDRRYDFNAPAAVRVTLLAVDGTRESLVIGSQNPVNRMYFASGAGRSACFPVASGLYERLRSLPRTLLLTTLLPSFAVDRIDSLEFWRGESPHIFARRDGRWWLRLTAGDSSRLGPIFRDLDRHYGDRVQERDGQRWALANDPAVDLLIHDVSRVAASEVMTGRNGAEARSRYGFADPWRQVVLYGQGINPDPGSGSSDRLEIVFGHREDAEHIPVARRGVILLTSAEAVISLEKPLSELLDLGAMPVILARGDSLQVLRSGEPVLRGRRDRSFLRPGKEALTQPSDQWQTVFPPRNEALYDEGAWHRMTRSLLINLDRTPILAVLPPTNDAAVLLDRERLQLTLWFEAAGGPDRLELEMGYLDEAKLPAGSPALVDNDDDLPPVGLWNPSSGQLLQVPGYALVTVRSWQR